MGVAQAPGAKDPGGPGTWPVPSAPVRGHSAGGGLASGGGDGSAPAPQNCFPGPRAAPRADTPCGVQRGLEGGAAQPPGVRRRWECQPKPQRAPCWAPGPHPKPSRPVGGRESSMPSPQDTLQPLNPTKKHRRRKPARLASPAFLLREPLCRQHLLGAVGPGRPS